MMIEYNATVLYIYIYIYKTKETKERETLLGNNFSTSD